MTLRKKWLMILSGIFLLVIISACSNQGNNLNEQSEPIEPKQFAEVLLAGEFKRIYAQMSDEFQKQVSLKEIERLGKDFNKGVDEFKLISEMKIDDTIQRLAWVDEEEEKGMMVVFNEDHTIERLQLIPLAKHGDTDEVFTETIFDFPFEDEWFVFWGGTNVLVNYHYELEQQRYAFDFLKIKDGKSYEGDASKNESYFAFGEKYLAPAAGIVIETENIIPDNDPVGDVDTENPAGNYVIIDHGNEEYSFLAHFKHGSIEVEEGDKVEQGDVLGLVGNSGNSSEPHIHFHVADAPDLEASKSIRINFDTGDSIIQGDFVK
ncbi:MAG TPA: peptidoglycan DD-metalloendopeptidase family protein [Bacillota bacterium]|nr:peptidoglycan DD-metalloendopeptidase family protein [Bacillota bacterium]